MTSLPRHSKSGEVVMAGDGGRVPDVSEQRAEVFTIRWDDVMGCYRVSVPMLEEARVVRVDDPASVLAALLAESPDATVSAIEALLTNDEAIEATGDAMDDWLFRVHGVISSARPQKDGEAHSLLSAACRSLLSKAPKGDG
jgi:hypothetical protein